MVKLLGYHIGGRESTGGIRTMRLMTMYTLSNEAVTIKVSSHGAELKSLINNATRKEYLWQAGPRYWGRTSPVLFPLVGNFKDKKYTYDGKTYSMSQHGFARDMEFLLVSSSENEIWFELRETKETYERYPFLFSLQIGYQLVGSSVKVSWKVVNTDKKSLYFSIGGHPAFLCPLNEEEKQTDCYIEFARVDKDVVSFPENMEYSLIQESGLLVKKTYSLVLENGRYQIADTLFDLDALIMEHSQANKVSLLSKDQTPYLSVEFDAPLFGVWSPVGKHAPFICIEPWYGRCDAEDFEGTLEEREWGNTLQSGEVFEAGYTICIE